MDYITKWKVEAFLAGCKLGTAVVTCQDFNMAIYKTKQIYEIENEEGVTFHAESWREEV